LLLPQAFWVKKTAIRLPDAAAPWRGSCSPAGCSSSSSYAALRLLVIGESTVAGVGVDTQQQALCGQLAEQLAATWSRPVSWQACGRNGATAADCCQELVPTLEDQCWDVVVIVLGVNDTTHLTPRWRWRRALRQLIDYFVGKAGQVLLTAVPPLGQFRALPQPLRGWFGLRAGLLDRDLQRCCARRGALHVPMALTFEAHYLARDGYHPSAAGYQLWAAGILACLIQSGWSALDEASSCSST
tara:strand:+ start:24951 stop:25679 length:729 start_codon:yes stop_codon:yes gene_type:complete